MTSASSETVREERAYAAGIQAALWGRPFVEYLNTTYAALKAGATHLNYWRKFDTLKTAADKYVNPQGPATPFDSSEPNEKKKTQARSRRCLTARGRSESYRYPEDDIKPE